MLIASRARAHKLMRFAWLPAEEKNTIAEETGDTSDGWVREEIGDRTMPGVHLIAMNQSASK